MKIPKDIQEQIEQDLEEEIRFVHRGEVVGLPKAAIITIMAIIRIRLESD